MSLDFLFEQGNLGSQKDEQAVEEQAEAEIIEPEVVFAEPKKKPTDEEQPGLFGEDADLLMWDEEQQAFVPVDDDALAALQAKGEAVDLYQTRPGSKGLEKLSWVNGMLQSNDSPQNLKSKLEKLAQENEALKKGATPGEAGNPDSGKGAGEMLGKALIGAGTTGKNTLTACRDTIKKWKADRAALTEDIQNNTAEQVAQRQEAGEGMGPEDLDDEGEVASSTKGLNADSIQKAAETMRENTQKFKQDFDQRRDQFRSSMNTNLETIFQAMGYGDPMKAKASSLQEFEDQLSTLPERKQEKVRGAIEAIQSESSNFKQYIEEKGDSPDAAKADVEDQEAFAKSVSEVKDDPAKEVDKKYRDMLENIGIGGFSIKEGLNNMFQSLSNLVNRVAERASLMKNNLSQAVSMNQGGATQQGDRLG